MTDTSFKIIAIGGESYPLFSFPLIKLKRITALAGRLGAERGEDTPANFRLVAWIVSMAIAGNGLFGRLEAYRHYRRFIRKARRRELVEALNTILEMISIREYYAVNIVSAEFNKLISK